MVEVEVKSVNKMQKKSIARVLAAQQTLRIKTPKMKIIDRSSGNLMTF